MPGIDLIARERQRQIEVEGLTLEHDRGHKHGELARAAALYALPPQIRVEIISVFWLLWPFGYQWWKPTPDNRIRELVKAGALIAAEIDRLQGEGEKND